MSLLPSDTSRPLTDRRIDETASTPDRGPVPRQAGGAVCRVRSSWGSCSGTRCSNWTCRSKRPSPAGASFRSNSPARSKRSQEIIDSWKGTALDNARSGLLLDFIFPLCYSTVLTIACFWAASLFRERGFRKTAWLATGIAWLQWPAAAV